MNFFKRFKHTTTVADDDTQEVITLSVRPVDMPCETVTMVKGKLTIHNVILDGYPYRAMLANGYRVVKP